MTDEPIKEMEFWNGDDLQKEMELLVSYGQSRGLNVTRFYFLIRHTEMFFRETLGIVNVETKVFENGPES